MKIDDLLWLISIARIWLEKAKLLKKPRITTRKIAGEKINFFVYKSRVSEKITQNVYIKNCCLFFKEESATFLKKTGFRILPIIILKITAICQVIEIY
ncbi:hypothetical protein CO115_02645 [Candidatus Falkowbacteria bacterium CG_4_9_14_3_um_filter_36_9]|uniref:Uncharacterized protein n=2 Tax=Candidatus Falkowiibacteriota TaxID=1752728 RepID=A0A1J4TDX7_9BACT|nr:MAG: hypothetical protein AUJ27_00340 [Candidatus Falkowbacteria bacterium CG1_02_37_44]PIV50766.1 MAG: hypothetical protein COS18_03985 [Candidatus Falkowbacteria bacterium CG02_land_8_20_14_3_00_36_14]PIX11958.1 MAG: hypothetical protein COZ73_01445 [Candidatus Falkowbacteria bacterium CG_4_8_14_3_um_filter_36_11]PJA10529.1 MAG: hypothetical protein COX67_04310 [Candidatus Falkowbacteria bacterium CG_4_10_14_0_2_um_filter_36_22]PJB19618.1 MAG: hypothetical protein CO115_02645 [Candidatus F